MNETLKVTPKKLTAAANKFNNSFSVVSRLTNQMVSMIDGLKSIWTGEAASSLPTDPIQ